jgi:hypothetical protein
MPGLTSLNAETAHTESIAESRLAVSVPVVKSETAVWSAGVRLLSLELDRERTIADRAFTDFSQGGNASAGSSGRKLFDDENQRAVSVNYFAHWKYPEGKSLYFFMSYSNNRSRFNNIPLPGVAYGSETRELRWMVGFPFASVNWSPGLWRLSAFGSPFGASTQLGYEFHKPWQAFVGWGWGPRSFQNLAPDVDDERLLYEKKEANAGVQWSPAPPIAFSAAYTYQYDRRFFIGQSATSRASSALLVADEGGALIKARWAF